MTSPGDRTYKPEGYLRWALPISLLVGVALLSVSVLDESIRKSLPYSLSKDIGIAILTAALVAFTVDRVEHKRQAEARKREFEFQLSILGRQVIRTVWQLDLSENVITELERAILRQPFVRDNYTTWIEFNIDEKSPTAIVAFTVRTKYRVRNASGVKKDYVSFPRFDNISDPNSFDPVLHYLRWNGGDVNTTLAKSRDNPDRFNVAESRALEPGECADVDYEFTCRKRLRDQEVFYMLTSAEQLNVEVRIPNKLKVDMLQFVPLHSSKHNEPQKASNALYTTYSWVLTGGLLPYQGCQVLWDLQPQTTESISNERAVEESPPAYLKGVAPLLSDGSGKE